MPSKKDPRHHKASINVPGPKPWTHLAQEEKRLEKTFANAGGGRKKLPLPTLD